MRSQLQQFRTITALLGVLGILTITAYNWRLWRNAETPAHDHQQSRSENTLAIEDDAPKISALVAAWNEADVIERHIESFLNLRYPNKELILCAGGSDRTFELARRYESQQVRVFRQEVGQGKQRSLAKGFEQSTGAILYFTDADCLFTNSAFERVITPILLDQEHATTGTSQPLPEQRRSLLASHLWARDLAANDRVPSYSDGLLGRNAALTRHALLRAGGLDFDAPTGTDYHLAKHLIGSGTSIRFVPESVVPSRYPDSFREYRNRQSRWLRNLILFGNRYEATADVRATVRTLMLALTMTGLPLIAIIFGRIPFLLWVVLMLHSVLARLRYMSALDQIEPGSTPRGYALAVVPLTFLDYIVSALPVVDLISKRRRERW
jgi:cellulose synthase/poly-beta-1,6-N-acetylglucosamine synthase-like glycosyltransferase